MKSLKLHEAKITFHAISYNVLKTITFSSMPLCGWFLAYNEGFIFSPSHVKADLTCQGSSGIFSTTIIASYPHIIYLMTHAKLNAIMHSVTQIK